MYYVDKEEIFYMEDSYVHFQSFANVFIAFMNTL